MNYSEMRNELWDFYREGTGERGERFRTKVFEKLDKMYDESLSAYEMKAMQYKTISEMLEPKLFYTSPYYYETATMWAHCDGSRTFRGYSHAGGWTFDKNSHLFRDQNPELYDLVLTHLDEILYNGIYNDTTQHFNFNNRPILAGGLKSVYEKTLNALKSAENDTERAYLETTCEGLLALKRISEKFSETAREMIETAPDEKARENMRLIYETARRVPWEKPETLYEALNTLAFMRKALGTLEGIGPNTFGRLDYDLAPFYENDIKEGRLTKDSAYDLICKFLLTWDLHFDHDFKMVQYADHELENTYVIGGCDMDGNPFCNDLTLMFLRASREEDIIFPKIVCRYNKNSPKEYLDEANIAVTNGTSTLLFQNDDATIPALIREGKTAEEARDFLITGCWGIVSNGVEKTDAGFYVNILKPLEYMLHAKRDIIEKIKIPFETLEDAESFEEVYETLCRNILLLMNERTRVLTLGGHVWDKVDPLTIFSSTFGNCIENRRDYTAGGAKYRNSHYELVGFPNVVDSLLAIKKLCFEDKKYTFRELLSAIRSNWEGYEDMRTDAIRCHGWGDGSAEASELAARFNTDLFDMASKQKAPFGDKVVIAHLTYTEVRWWGLKTLATPDGRKDGEYIAQGLTPSRLKKIPSATSVINSLSHIDSTEISGNSVINIILPNKTTVDTCEAFLRAAAGSAMQSLQLNCTSREQLLDAQKNPEKYPTLIVRVCGFSAKFTSLSPEWQEEVLTRNFFE